jgi:hypothetical protein
VLAGREGGEHLSLSRLQHTHIVPLHSVHDFPERGLRGLCQPHFGGASLAKLLHLLREVPPSARSGANLVRALERAQEEPAALPVRGPTCRFLTRAGYVEAVCWLGACLADALHFARARPDSPGPEAVNVLLASDGQPMLLDFHLPVRADGRRSSSVRLRRHRRLHGPEHQAALAAVAGRHDVPTAVDAGQIYSLGVTLYESLGGSVPVPSGGGRWAAATKRSSNSGTRGHSGSLSDARPGLAI